eukprot:m.71095 g.71095  ORF g.71095 m.71095 type:complete len:554 (+) comp8337_c1_seq1:58-1719(+)
MDAEQNLATYNKFVAEGQNFEQSLMYPQALDCYTNAIDALSVAGVLQDETAKMCLCLRSKCYLKLGDHENALKDAESALDVDKEFIKGFYAKAEALYQKGDFENSLVFFQRGHEMRPDMKDFSLGKQKAREAIDNAIGDTKKCHLTVEGDLEIYFEGLEETKKGKGKGGSGQPSKKTKRGRSAKKNVPKEKSIKSMKQLLGELYTDRAYLEELMNDKSLNLGEAGQDIKSLAHEGLQYLDKRTEFWRQQKPIYARVNERKQKKAERNHRSTQHLKETKKVRTLSDSEVLNKIMHLIATATQQFNKEEFGACISTCDEVCAHMESDNEDVRSAVAVAFSMKGSCLMVKEDYGSAELAFLEDVKLSTTQEDATAKYRSLANLGRCRSSAGAFKEAGEAFKEASVHVSDPLQAAWLYHELGRCYVELGEYERALDVAEKAIDESNLADNRNWLLYANILKAQVQKKLGDRTDAVETYTTAGTIAGSLYKRSVRAAIENEKDDLRRDSIAVSNGNGYGDEDFEAGEGEENEEDAREGSGDEGTNDVENGEDLEEDQS